MSIAIVAVMIVGTGFFFLNEEKPNKEIKESGEKDLFTVRILDRPTDHQSWDIVQKLTGRDIFKEEGIKLERITSVQSTGGTDSIQALLANNIDFANSAFSAWINVIVAGGKVKVIVNGGMTSPPITKDDPGIGLSVLENSSIISAKDLIGKKVAVNVLGAQRDYDTRLFLKKNGYSIDQVQLVVIPGAQSEQVLRIGQVDAAWISEENFGLAMERGGIRVINGTRSYDLKGNNIIGGGGVREDFIKEHPDQLIKFITAFEKSQRFVWDEFQKDPEKVKNAVAEILKEKGGNPKIAKYFRPKWSPEYPFSKDTDIQIMIEILESEGKLKPGQIRPSDVFTHEFNPYYTGEIK